MSRRMYDKPFDGGKVINPFANKPREPRSEEEKLQNRLDEADRKQRLLMAKEEPAAKKRYQEASRKKRRGEPLTVRDQLAIDRYNEIKKRYGLLNT